MKTRLSPIRISLQDLPTDGREYTFTSESGELNAALSDLIGSNPFVLNFKIVPMGNSFDLKGELTTKMDLQCSLCAMDFKYSVRKPLHELIVIQKPMGKNDHLSRANHAHELLNQGPDYIILPTTEFDVAEYAHEAIALAEPIRPIGKPDCDKDCENLKDRVQRDWLSYGEGAGEDPITVNPFRVLEKLKLKD